MALTFNDRERIQKEVILGIKPAQIDTTEQLEFRKKLTVQTIKATQDGIILDFQNDWDA